MPDFKLDPTADTNGTSLQVYLDGVTEAALTRAFGAPRDGYWDDEKGYDGKEWTFSADDGRVFNVYARFGSWRVGAHGPVDDFKAWLLGRLGN